MNGPNYRKAPMTELLPSQSVRPFFQALTQLPPEVERKLIEVPYRPLSAFLHTHSPISGADTIYSLVQWIAREVPLPKIEAFLKQDHKDDTPPRQAPVKAAPAGPAKQKPPRTASSTQHPQAVINAKTEIAKAAGGSISYSRAPKGWLVVYPGGKQEVWASDDFRDMTLEEVAQKFK